MSELWHRLHHSSQNRDCGLLIAAFAASTVHRQDGPLVPGVLSQMEQPPKQSLDGFGPPLSNGGIL